VSAANPSFKTQPTVSVRGNDVIVTFSTPSAGGLTLLDFNVARAISLQAAVAELGLQETMTQLDEHGRRHGGAAGPLGLKPAATAELAQKTVVPVIQAVGDVASSATCWRSFSGTTSRSGSEGLPGRRRRLRGRDFCYLSW
jgi:hypothetical protein